jgi:hypothetical protein
MPCAIVVGSRPQPRSCLQGLQPSRHPHVHLNPPVLHYMDTTFSVTPAQLKEKGAGRAPYWPRDADGLAAAACCGNAACRPGPLANAAAPQAGEPETLLHALLECPAVAPALQWAADVWARIEGGTGPPLSPQVWLQGDSGAWKPRDPNLGDLWHALRIAVLAAAWRLRCRRAFFFPGVFTL